MEKINYELNCLWGKYTINIEFDDSKVIFYTHSDIDNFIDKNIEIDSKDFLKLIQKANIKKWISNNKQLIEDGTSWILKYETNNQIIDIKGVEGDWPYGFNYFEDALSLIDDDYSKLRVI